MTKPTAEQLRLARECAVTAAHSARFDDEILSFWTSAWSDMAKGIFEEGATQSALLAIQATEARMAEAVEALEEIAAQKLRVETLDYNPDDADWEGGFEECVKRARQALAMIRSQSNG